MGSPMGGPTRWVAMGRRSCDSGGRILCMGRTKTAALAPPAATGKRIWLTSASFTPGGATPDAACRSERPSGVAEARALITYADHGVESIVDPAASYVRPASAELSRATSLLSSGRWGFGR